MCEPSKVRHHSRTFAYGKHLLLLRLMKNTIIRVVLIILIMVSLGLALYASRDAKQAPLAAEVPSVQENTSALTLPTGATLQSPKDWEIKKLAPAAEYQTYEIVAPEGQFSISELNTIAWLKGPSPEEGYVISHEYRPKALSVLQNIYQHESITADDRKQFEENAGEFLGYSQNYRSALSYIASTDNSYRGISFYAKTWVFHQSTMSYSIALQTTQSFLAITI